ncbi:MAG: response regulator [Rhodobacteraceae bacterium]|nr:response regulator [Paracoccaceae bacterium]
MTLKKQFGKRQITVAVLFGLLVVLAGWQTQSLGRQVVAELDELSITQNDDIRWNLIQGEVELMQLRFAIDSALNEGGSLETIRKRFDIFFSRVSTFREGTLYVELARIAQSSDAVQEMSMFLGTWTPYVDGPDIELRTVLPGMETAAEELHTTVRNFVLAGVRLHAAQADARRAQVSGTLTELALSALTLVATLLTGVVILWRMFRQLGRVSAEREVALARLEAMVESSLDAILVIGRNGALRDCNGAAESVFGYDGKDIATLTISDLLVLEETKDRGDLDLVAYLKDLAVQSSKRSERVRLQGRRKSGLVFPVEMSLRAAISEREEVYVAFLRDISARVRSEDALRLAHDDALAGNLAKSRLLTVMSHEMRTPLNGVLGALDMLETKGLTDDQKRFTEAIRVSGDLLLHHVNDVLELSRLESGADHSRAVTFDLEASASALLDSQQAVARQRDNTLSLRCNLGPSSRVVGDAVMIQKSLLNLVGNALKFTRSGEILVEIDRLGGSEMVEIRVMDSGLGIKSEDLERVFDEFVMVDTGYARSAEGTGLGLAITRRMVETMGGTIGAESEAGEGSLFWIRLPLPVAPSEQDANAEGVSEATASGKQSLKVLVVEDNEINRTLLVEMLRSQGHEVSEACEGLDGVTQAAAREFDVILMDISMPKMDGITALQKIRKEGANKATPVLALTAHAAREDHARFQSAGFADVLTKPFSTTRLVDAMRQASEGRGINSSATEPNASPAFLLDMAQMLGRDRTDQFLNRFADELDVFLSDLGNRQEMDASFRNEAHRLAGSAAFLGFSSLQKALNGLETAEGTRVADLQQELMVQRNVVHQHLNQKTPGRHAGQ